ncbi:unnamed protein product [Medioppia subpectinata]|uniref:long-chain-fatty-acid--CoA ligase n=1 Tax=Medioppia subpectinata TaxID=1979941 RepID=A0A7R9KBL9_9ACAR|nr:unnamed protein product [Medioppia subpectinata]CAG2100424.1 unnamed protein product [Medioppia subpectinata]
MSKLLVNLFMLKTRLVVNAYTVTTLPLYYVIQKPWRTVAAANKVRTKNYETINGEVVWSRSHPLPDHTFLQYNSYAEVLKNLKNNYASNRPMLGKRDVIRETVEKDINEWYYSGFLISLNHSFSLCFTSKPACFLHEVPNLKSIVYIKNTKDQTLSDSFPDNLSVKSLEQLEECGTNDKRELEYDLPKDTKETAVIMYTSGTTGNPKAVCISHKSLMASLKVLLSNTTDDMSDGVDNHSYMSYLPLAHILGFTFEMFLLFGGVRIGYSSPFTLTDTSPGLAKGQLGDARLLQPTSMTAVPLVLDRILKEIYEKLNSRSPILS